VTAVVYSGGMSQELSQERGVRQDNISKLAKATRTEEMSYVSTNAYRDPLLPVRGRSAHRDKINYIPQCTKAYHKINAMHGGLCETADRRVSPSRC
jgi:hypothetical protein